MEDLEDVLHIFHDIRVFWNLNADTQGYVERCSFEHGLCSWVQDDESSPGAEWSRHRGAEAWPELGPHRDHTLNSNAGTGLPIFSTTVLRVDALWMKLSVFQAYLLPYLMVSYLHAGHYVVPPIETRTTSEIISRTLLPSSNCTVCILWLSFFFCCPLFSFGATLILPGWLTALIDWDLVAGETTVQWTCYLRFEGVVTGPNPIKTHAVCGLIK